MIPTASDPSPRTILDMATAFQRSRALLTAYELEIFTVLNDESRTSVEVASAVGCDARATDRLMNALVAMGLLEKEGALFRNSAAAAAYLVKGKPAYMGNLSHTNHLWDTWSQLTTTVRDGRPPASIGAIDDRGDEWLRPFIAAMHWRARQSAADVVKRLDLAGVTRVLDVGGGSGAYAMAFARARQGISVVVFDLPSVVPLTRGYIQAEALSSEVATVEGDYLRDPLGSGYDLVFMSAVIHSNAPEENRLLFGKAAAALQPGGRLVVQDFLMLEDRSGPPQAALFALNMLVGTRSGDTFTESEVRGWMSDARLEPGERIDTAIGTNIIVGRKG